MVTAGWVYGASKGLLVLVGNPRSGVSNFGREFVFSDVISSDEASKEKTSYVS